MRVLLQLRVEPNAVLVPEQAIRMGQQGPFLYVLEPNTMRVQYRLIEKGNRIDHWVIVNKGVKAGEKIVVKGQVNLKPNAKVYLTP